ncbi:ABC transporter ATP-binding protein [Sporolactobacillus laevolacticus]|uniref:ABC transporter ATP-binding protein n=1 Tax=Sporolactobacillus laevolacticus DSM 442 TaxID=1395513 RepID=V6ITU7_9BACL|nr:ABC transporter ATP-binding protein [Sporolactobacillus laevolacticus]EST10257.1 ABC transporter ATP-binding protein [Sporolactobacillus laevolacticus DSM 442]
MKHLKKLMKNNKLMVSSYLFLGIVLAFLNNYSATYFQKLIDKFNDGSLSIGLIAIYGTLLILLSVLSYVDEYPGRKLEHGIYLNLKLMALHKINKIDYLVYQTIGTGKLIQRIENGAAAGKGILFDFAFTLVRDIIPSIIFSMIFILTINKMVMLTILAGYIVVFTITNLLLKVLYRIKERILTNEEKLNHFLVRGFMEMVIFRLNKRFNDELKKAREAKDEIVTAKVKMTLIHEAFFAIFALLIIFVKIAIIMFGWITGSLSIGAIVALISLVDHAYTPIAIFNVLFVQYKLDKTAFKRYEEFLDSPDDKQLTHGTPVSLINGNISFHQLRFNYGNRTIVKNLNLSIKKGESVAFVGESGSGKSTIVKLLVGLLKPDGGEILVDGYSFSSISLNSYYDQIAYVPQESPVFDGTLRENIVFDRVVEDKKIIKILNKVGLNELYHKLEKGLDTELGERGQALSGGERQRLALARLWFSDAKLIILDEATSAMDNLTEESVMAQLAELLHDKTVIVIAHRLNIIRNFKRIIAFKNGEIIGQGDFPTLLETNPYFHELYYAHLRK